MAALLFALISAASTISGGLLPLYTRIQRIGSRYLMGFAAGVMLSVAFLDLLPELAEESEASFLPVALGFFAIYAVEKLVMVHSCPEGECDLTHATTSLGWTAIIGIAAESLLDGIAIAIGFSLAPAVGLSIAIAVVVHEFPRGFTTALIMRAAGYGPGRIWAALGIDALFTPLGVVLVQVGIFPESLFPLLLGFAAGTFIYVGAADLLPEAHRTFNVRVVAAVLVGFVLILALGPLTHL